MNKMSYRFSPEVRDRAVRLVGEHRGDYALRFASQFADRPKADGRWLSFE
jgi:hypothetical protein